MEIYLDANATTPVLPEARAAAIAAMDHDYGNPSSVHSTGLRARALMDSVRARARRVLRVTGGHLLFVSGATEGIQTAVLSAMTALRDRRRDAAAPCLVLYGATEHKAVPEAIRHWNDVLRLGLEVMAIPVGSDGRHDLGWLGAHAPRAGLVCTMAVNNETGVVSDLDGIAEALKGGDALWLVDGVQALGKIDLRLGERRIDYAPFSGHKLYAPKGIGLLYVRDGAPITPLLAGGGQEQSLRSGTENMPGIAAFGAVLAALEEGRLFQLHDSMKLLRGRLVQALGDAFPAIVFNAPEAACLPTTLNFSVPGLGSRLLLDLFDAAGIRISAGSACGASKAQPSFVLEAMGLPAWRTASAVRMSFGPATEPAVVDEACRRIRNCGESLRVARPTLSTSQNDAPDDGLDAAAFEARGGAMHESVELSPAEVVAWVAAAPNAVLVDVREAYEQWVGESLDLGEGFTRRAAPLSGLIDALPDWIALPSETPLLFFCRSGNRSAIAAAAVRRLGHARAFSVAGGLALWPGSAAARASKVSASLECHAIDRVEMEIGKI